MQCNSTIIVRITAVSITSNYLFDALTILGNLYKKDYLINNFILIFIVNVKKPVGLFAFPSLYVVRLKLGRN